MCQSWKQYLACTQTVHTNLSVNLDDICTFAKYIYQIVQGVPKNQWR